MTFIMCTCAKKTYYVANVVALWAAQVWCVRKRAIFARPSACDAWYQFRGPADPVCAAPRRHPQPGARPPWLPDTGNFLGLTGPHS